MGKYRKRFNEKARSGMLAKQAALKKARNKQFYRETEQEQQEEPNLQPIQDSNSEILAPVSTEERLARKRALEESLYSQNAKEEKLSKSKKKRLDKYIEHQLKREEKKILLEKLSHTKMDTSQLANLKELGKGKLTRREEMIEALKLEKQGRANEKTKEILYEARDIIDDEPELANYDDESESESESENENGEEEVVKSTFIDNRPAKFGGTGSGFGFSNIPTIKKDSTDQLKKKKYSWRQRVQDEEKKKLKIDDENDFLSSSEEEEEEDGEEDSNSEESVDDNDNDGEDIEAEEDDNEEQDENGVSNEDEHEDEEEDEEEDESSEEEDESESESEPEQEEEQSKLMASKSKHSKTAESFKNWAEQQVRKLENRQEMIMPELSPSLKSKYSKPTIHEEDIDHSSDEEGYIPINKQLKREAFVVDVIRDETVQQQRIQLPVFQEEHRIMEAIYHHDCIILCGETGSGKTTQVPQFLLEAGFGNLKNNLYPGMIGITQPRRVAAVSMAERVGNELGNFKNRVGYQIRFDTTIKNEGKEDGTVIKFMTDGVLLREMMSDFLLSKYSSIIIDEAHERNINTDILIGMLTRIMKLRRKYHENDSEKYKPLKLIIMSATLRVSDFSENHILFKTPPPIINVQARQYPVSIHFNKRTNHDYLEEAFNKACKVHKKLPDGGILVFLTGQTEINTLVKRLRDEFPFKKSKKQEIIYDKDTEVKLSENVQHEVEDVEFIIENDETNYDDYDNVSDSEEEGFEEAENKKEDKIGPLYVLPLYSLLPTNQQMKVFEKPPNNSRLCIISTNVAETSLTIPGIRYVIDCGRSKERKFNSDNGVQSFEIDWISKASADQRSGRAGRTGPGHCYRLYSSAVFEEFFPKFSVPEILRMPFESIVLNMKSMGIDHITNFPFPTPPDRESLNKAEKLLVILGALDENKTITELGKKMSLFPLSPRFAKILIIGNQQNCLNYIIAIVSALSVGDPFISENEIMMKMGESTEEAKKQFKSKFFQSRALFSRLDPSSDVMMLLSVVCAFDHVAKDKIDQFITDNYLRFKMMEEIQKLRKQVTILVENSILSSKGLQVNSESKLPPPNKKQISAMKQMIASGFIDQIAIRGDLINSDVKIMNKMSINQIPYCPVLPISDPFIYIHSNSIINKSGEIPPNYLVYQSLNKKGNTDQDEVVKVRMRPLVDISGKQLTNISKNSPLLTYSKPLGHPFAPRNITPTKRECYVVPRFGASIGSGGVGWDLPAIKVIQEKKQGNWVNL
ncbi:unnamed protein product [Candida verbasci]|uniref:RNA helicase n=1 Tax=Candida verbasci TaxID=1227364 RepID=A0A9W4TSV5_9ASCO|nr:unnamed protein product [Candida verbasci]